jgi:hypothetical protein
MKKLVYFADRYDMHAKIYGKVQALTLIFTVGSPSHRFYPITMLQQTLGVSGTRSPLRVIFAPRTSRSIREQDDPEETFETPRVLRLAGAISRYHEDYGQALEVFVFAGFLICDEMVGYDCVSKHLGELQQLVVEIYESRRPNESAGRDMKLRTLTDYLRLGVTDEFDAEDLKKWKEDEADVARRYLEEMRDIIEFTEEDDWSEIQSCAVDLAEEYKIEVRNNQDMALKEAEMHDGLALEEGEELVNIDEAMEALELDEAIWTWTLAEMRRSFAEAEEAYLQSVELEVKGE